MACASGTPAVCTKETTNYARLCRLLVEVGSKALRETFDEICPPDRLHEMLSSHPVRDRLESLYKGRQKVLKPTQWAKLYPSHPSFVSSREFDITLLMVLLRSTSGLNPPDTGWSNPPAATDTSIEADIARVRICRNNVYAHASHASVDDLTFSKYWQDIRRILIRLGGERYGPYIDKLKVDCMDPDFEVHYQELLKQWAVDEGVIEQMEDSVGCLYAETIDIPFLEPCVDFKSVPNCLTTKRAALRSLIRSLQFWRKRKPVAPSRSSGCRMQVSPMKEEVACTKNRINRIPREMCQIDEESRVTKQVITELEEAINFHQSDHIAEARKKLCHVFQTVSDTGVKDRFFKIPTEHGLRVLARGKELFVEDGVSCTVKHETLLLDSSNSGAQFHISLLNVLGAFAEVVSEIKIAKEIFSLLIRLHEMSDATSRKRDLGAAYNNRGCISLIMGDLKDALRDFDSSLKHLESEKRRQRDMPSLLETMFISVKSNIARLHFLLRDFSEALEMQEELANKCKEKGIQELPLQVVFTVLNNHAVLCTTLGNFHKAEMELGWLISYCYKMNREDCGFLLNFVSLHLSEVLLFHGKSKEAERASRLDTFKSADGIELVQMFGGLHINVRTEAVEKLIDVIFLKGKIKFACELLETSVNILKKSFGPDHFNVASLLYKQGTILSSIGEVSSAAEKFKCSIDILQEIFGIKHPLLLKCYMSLGDLTFRMQRSEDSYFYFQRAMENIEELYQVSFVSELARKYMEITKNSKPFRGRTMRDNCRIEGLVAEYGLAFAVLLSRLVVPDNDRPFIRRRTTSVCMEIITLKCTRDFLLSGQTFLRQGMTKEALAFFQQAGKYCAEYQMVKDHPNAGLARLHSVLIERSLIGKQEGADCSQELNICLKELKEVMDRGSTDKDFSDGTTQDMTAMTSDCQVNLKLILVFLILLSIKLKMIEATFAAYDLYAKLFQNNNNFLFLVNDGIQVYASRKAITCNGKTAVQDVLVTSAAGLNEIQSECPLHDKQLFRMLACKKNVSRDSFLVTYSSSIRLDIADLQALEKKTSLSIQECFQLKCFDSGIEGNASQVVVDLTSTSSCDYGDIFATRSHIELLSLCLSEGGNVRDSYGRNVFDISAVMCQNTTHFTFEDEHTSSFMFSKTALSLLKRWNSGKISTVSLQRHCLTLTIIHPVKARLTLWRKNRCIKQKLQFVQAAASHDLTDGTVSQPTFLEEPSGDYHGAEGFSLTAIDHLAKKYHVACKIDIFYSDVRLDDSEEYYEQNGIQDEHQPKQTYCQISSQEYEQNETLRNHLNATVLEGLTAVSEISRQLYGDGTQEGDDAIEVVSERTETSYSPNFSQSQVMQEIISGSLQQTTWNPEAEIASHNLTVEDPDSAAIEEEPWTREGNLTAREEDDDNDLGRSLFEKDRKSRRSFMAELQKSLKNEEETSRLNFEEAKSLPDEVIRKGGNLVLGLKKPATRYMVEVDQTGTYSEKRPSNAEAELQIQSTSELWSHDGEPREADCENALGRHCFEEDRKSRSVCIAKLKSPKKDEISQRSNSLLGEKNSLPCEKTSGKQDSLEDPNYFEELKDESSPVRGVSAQMAQEDDKQNIFGTTAENLLPKAEVEDAALVNLSQSETRFTTHDQTQHRHRSNLQEVHRPIEGVKDYEMLDRGSNEVPNEPLRNKGTDKPVSYANTTKRETSRSSFDVDDNVVPDGPENGRRIKSYANDSMFLPNTAAVDKSLERVGKNLQIKSGLLLRNETGMGTLGRSNVDDNYGEALQKDIQSTGKSQLFHTNLAETTFRHPHLGFQGGDVPVDGDNSNASCAEEDVVDGPVLEIFPNKGGVGIHRGKPFKKSVDPTKEISGNENTSFPLDTGRDVIDGAVYRSKIDANLNNMASDFGGARPKERLTNTFRGTSTTKSSITEPLSAYQQNRTDMLGIYPRFLERHTMSGNGAILEAALQEGYQEHYHPDKAMTYGEKRQAPCGRFNTPGHVNYGSGLGLDAGQAYVTRTSTPDEVQSVSTYQKPPLHQNESWHFPPLVTDETTAMESNLHVDQEYAIQQHSTKMEDYTASKVEALFGSNLWRSTYNEMDSITNEYHDSIGDNGAVQSPKMSAGQRMSTEDSASSLLGSLQQIMAKTVNLIVSRDTVGKRSQQEPKETEKVGIQEEARGSRDQEQSVTAVVEESMNQEESSQENEQTEDTERQSIATPVQETPRPVCSHYQRRCLVRFPCCGKFYPCHRCHNESEDCSDDQARAINATHIRCTICYHEQAIDEQSQHCGGCKSKMSEYFCAICKHFTSVDKNPFHCGKCGICRIHRDRSFHCDVCNVCLDKRLQGKHKCRPDSGHDECCICLEDAFSGCQILPCSHKVHKDCAIAMIQNGVRTCPICRHPLFSQPQNSPQ